MQAGLKEPGREYYDTVYTSPFGNQLLLDFVLRALDEENLGRHDVPDFLGVSFPANDPIGHLYGPDSQEVLDVTLRSDLIVRNLAGGPRPAARRATMSWPFGRQAFARFPKFPRPAASTQTSRSQGHDARGAEALEFNVWRYG